MDDDDDDGGWIVDEHGKPIKRRQRRMREGDSGALRDAEDLFGVGSIFFILVI